jgi:hypothetical protein
MTPTFVEARELGVLRGNGLESWCYVEIVTQVHQRFTEGAPRREIVWVEKQLPDGNYKLYVSGNNFDIARHSGAWEACPL